MSARMPPMPMSSGRCPVCSAGASATRECFKRSANTPEDSNVARAVSQDWSRREFLKASGALVVTFGATAVAGDLLSAQGQFDTRASHVDPAQLDSWIAVNADGSVTAFTGKCELGQGMLTA